MQLHYRDFPSSSERTPLIMLHGLFGSSVNLQFFAKNISADRRVILPDLRNHGQSPHHDAMNFQVMMEDVMRLMDDLSFEKSFLLGHSMGGKVAMWLALNHPDRVKRLMVADIAPVTYSNRFKGVLSVMQSLNLSLLESRKDADQFLSKQIADAGVRAYLLQNLALNTGRQWQWKLNLPVLAEKIESIMTFPASSLEYHHPVLFLKGDQSDYINQDNEKAVYQYFPSAEIRVVSDAGHWLYAQQPKQFLAAINQFMQ